MSEQPVEMPRPKPQVGLAISWAFDTFRRTPVPFIALAAVVAVIQMVQQVGTQPINNIVLDCNDAQTAGQQAACAAALGGAAVVGVAVMFLFLILAFFATIGVYRAALDTSNGIAPDFKVIFKTENLGRYVVFSLAYAGLVIAGLVLCILPGIAVAFLLQLGPFYILDRGNRPVEAIKASYAAITKNFGPAVVMVLFSLVVSALGSALYGILTLVTLPFATLFIVHMFRQFNGEPVR